jgi:hypothetical protein
MGKLSISFSAGLCRFRFTTNGLLEPPSYLRKNQFKSKYKDGSNLKRARSVRSIKQVEPLPKFLSSHKTKQARRLDLRKWNLPPFIISLIECLFVASTVFLAVVFTGRIASHIRTAHEHFTFQLPLAVVIPGPVTLDVATIGTLIMR